MCIYIYNLPEPSNVIHVVGVMWFGGLGFRIDQHLPH